MKIASTVILGIIVIGLLAFVPPQLLETEILGEHKAFAEQSLSVADMTLDNNFERLLILSYGVKVNETDGTPTSTTITAYTVFGIPYAVVNADPTSAGVERRLWME